MKQKIHTEHAPQAIGTYSQAIKVGNTVYLSGQIAVDSKNNSELISDDFRLQATQVFNNLQAVAKAAGGSLDAIVKLTIYLIDFKEFPIVNEVMTDFFKDPYPARATIAVSALPKAAKIEVEAVMVI